MYVWSRINIFSKVKQTCVFSAYFDIVNESDCYHLKDNQGRDDPTKIRCPRLSDDIMVNVMCQSENDIIQTPSSTSCEQHLDKALQGSQIHFYI